MKHYATRAAWELAQAKRVADLRRAYLASQPKSGPWQWSGCTPTYARNPVLGMCDVQFGARLFNDDDWTEFVIIGGIERPVCTAQEAHR